MIIFTDSSPADLGEGGGGDRASGPTLINHQNIGFSKQYIAPDPLKNHKAAKPEFNVGPSWARQQNAI